MIISGQQKIMLSKWEKGFLKSKDLYRFLSSRVNEIPREIVENGSDEEAIKFCIKTAIVKTNPHKSINFYSKLKQSRMENILRLKKAGII